ncbi:MAG: Type 1 glutamine amidotransferase-like domain-containing protein [Candidatus Acidiferrales bacterium]
MQKITLFLRFNGNAEEATNFPAVAGSRAKLFVFIGVLFLAAVTLALSRAAASGTPYKYIRIGNPKNIRVAPHPGYALIGGGEDLDAAFQWLCQRSSGGDFLVLRASGTDAYNPYIQKLCRENSVATLIIPSRDAAENPFVAKTIRAAAAIFIAGGDQANYINFWRGTPVQRELNSAIRRGVPVGGTSAGLAVLGEFAYTSQNDKPNGSDLSSAMALANPFHPQVVIARNFLMISALRGVITDSHFHARDRLGRTLVFMARILASGDAPRIHDIGIDQHTAVLLDPDGHAIVAGSGAVYFFAAAQRPAICRRGVPLTFSGISVRKLVAGEKFDLTSWSGSGVAYSLSVASGALRSSQPSGSIY